MTRTKRKRIEAGGLRAFEGRTFEAEGELIIAIRRDGRKTTQSLGRAVQEKPRVEQRVQVGVECPQCHWRHFLEVEMDEKFLNTPLAREIRHHLEAWIASRCPDHLGLISKFSKN
ncbi:MAG: hypothetical protein DMG23_06570 [Acidobacteria bacterium]|nr:MAG: hypothetical protein DMG23_06570 [Acidobacteriota bacterium]